MVLLYELKNALAACEQELHSLKGQFEAACPGKVWNENTAHFDNNNCLLSYKSNPSIFISVPGDSW